MSFIYKIHWAILIIVPNSSRKKEPNIKWVSTCYSLNEKSPSIFDTLKNKNNLDTIFN